MNELEEQRVIEVLRAITGGLTVTERDTIDASTRLQHNLKAPPPRRNLALIAVAAAVVLIVGFATFRAINGDEKSATDPAGTPPSAADVLQKALGADPFALAEAEFLVGTRPTAQSLAGLWLWRPNDPSLSVGEFESPMYVDGDGDWRIGDPTAPFLFGVSSLAGDTWTRRGDERGQCARNQQQVGYLDQPAKAALAPDGSLHVQFATVEDGCTAALNGREVWIRVAPGSPVMDYLGEVSGEIQWEAASDGVGAGVYVAPGTGHMLVVDLEGSYRYYDNLTAAKLVVADKGEFDVDVAQGTVDATCVGGSFTGRVEAGETPGVAGYVRSFPAMRITTAEQGCGSDVAAQGVWVHIPGGATEIPYPE